MNRTWIAACFLECTLALHHAEPGDLAQLLHQRRGDFRHVFSSY